MSAGCGGCWAGLGALRKTRGAWGRGGEELPSMVRGAAGGQNGKEKRAGWNCFLNYKKKKKKNVHCSKKRKESAIMPLLRGNCSCIF